MGCDLIKYKKEFLVFHFCMMVIALYLYTMCDMSPINLIGAVFFPYLYIPWIIALDKCEN